MLGGLGGQNVPLTSVEKYTPTAVSNEEVTLPPDLKPGTYRLFLRARFGGVKVGDSYAWVTELPRRP